MKPLTTNTISLVDNESLLSNANDPPSVPANNATTNFIISV